MRSLRFTHHVSHITSHVFPDDLPIDRHPRQEGLAQVRVGDLVGPRYDQIVGGLQGIGSVLSISDRSDSLVARIIVSLGSFRPLAAAFVQDVQSLSDIVQRLSGVAGGQPGGQRHVDL